MNALNSHARISLTLDIAWSSGRASHLDRYFIRHLNPWRDLLPGDFLTRAMEKAGGVSANFRLVPGQLIPDHDPAQVRDLDYDRLDLPAKEFRSGCFYPQGLVRGLPGVFKGNLAPFRCLEKSIRGIRADFNPPLAGRILDITLGNPVLDPPKNERGGSCTDWMALALDGPGMQAYGAVPDFFSGAAFDRPDPLPDRVFYGTDRFVHHIDDTARKHLAGWYDGLLKPGGRILDLMAGWDSHLSADGRFCAVHGLGLNANEMAANPALTGFSVQDLNRNPVLPFEDRSFDGVICSLSVEYLVKPVAVFREVARVLRPGGMFALSFSNRWFPEKAIRIWGERHEFERPAFVLACLERAGEFTDLATFTLRGYPRPASDRHFPALALSDPVYGVSGVRAG